MSLLVFYCTSSSWPWERIEHSAPKKTPSVIVSVMELDKFPKEKKVVYSRQNYFEFILLNGHIFIYMHNTYYVHRKRIYRLKTYIILKDAVFSQHSSIFLVISYLCFQKALLCFIKQMYFFPQLGLWLPLEKLVLANCELIQFWWNQIKIMIGFLCLSILFEPF